MSFLYTVKPLPLETIALEELRAEVKRYVSEKPEVNNIKNILQEYREEISSSMSDLVRADPALADTYLDQALTHKYTCRLAELSGDIFASVSVLSVKIGRGDFRILPDIISEVDRKRLDLYKGRLPTYQEARKFLQAIRLFTLSLNILPTYTNWNNFTSEEKASNVSERTKALVSNFDSPYLSFASKGDLETYSIEPEEKEGEYKNGFLEAGWSYEKVKEYQLNFGNQMQLLSNAIYEIAKAINNFSRVDEADGTFGYFTVYAERLTEALNRIPSMFIKAYALPWVGFKTYFKG